MAPKNRMVGFYSHFDPGLNGASKTTSLGVGLLVCFSFFFHWLKTLALVLQLRRLLFNMSLGAGQ